MENDDRQVGRILSRREVIALLGAGGSALLLGGGLQAATIGTDVYQQRPRRTPPPTATRRTSTATPTRVAATATPSPVATSVVTPVPACVVRPQKTVGPYFVDEMLNRSDIRADPATGVVKAGVQLDLKFAVSRISNSSCSAFSGAQVDVWHCDAGGLYSDVSANNTVGQKFLRGYQLTDANGVAQFTTIYPGWYNGRAVHIHFKIRATASTGASYEFISQLFFDDSLTDSVFTQAPYNTRGTRSTRNSNDNVYGSDGGQLLLSLAQTATGYSATFEIGLTIP